jgi:hypothetical protein
MRPRSDDRAHRTLAVLLLVPVATLLFVLGVIWILARL